MLSNYGYRYELENSLLLNRLTTSFAPIQEISLKDAPEEIDPRKWHRIENQGSMGSCRGHSLSSIGEYCYYIATGEVKQFSPLFAYYATQKVDGLQGADRGSTISGGMEVATKIGFCPLEIMPYPKPVKYHWELPQPALDAAKDFLVKKHYQINTYDDWFKFLASGQGGIDFGLLWSKDMTPDSDGIIWDYTPGGGGHAVCSLGYTKRRDNQGRNFIILVNSWDVTWGKGGYAEVAPDAVTKILRAGWTVARGVSDMVSPKFREIPDYGLF